jgi:hypothetical protein
VPAVWIWPTRQAIAYGYPGPELMAAAERDEVLLGRCVMSEEMPLVGCADCGWPRSGSGRAIGEADADRCRQTEQDEDLIAVPDPGSAWWVIREFALTFEATITVSMPPRTSATGYAVGSRTGSSAGRCRPDAPCIVLRAARFHHLSDSPVGEDDSYVRGLEGQIG